MDIPPINTLSYVKSNAKLSPTLTEFRITRYIEINGVQKKVETQLLTYNREGELEVHKEKGNKANYYA